MSVNDTFEKKDGTKISFKDYFEQQYKLNIRELNQPLLVSENLKTGMTDAHRADFRLMKDLSVVLHKSAEVRSKEVSALIDEMSRMERVKAVQDKWNIKIERAPLEVKG